MIRNLLIWILALGMISVPVAEAGGAEDRIDGRSNMETDSRWQDELDKSLDALERRLQKYGRNLEKLPERKEYRQMKNRLGEWAAEMERTGEEVREKIERRWLPRVRKELDALEHWLRERTRKSEDGRVHEV